MIVATIFNGQLWCLIVWSFAWLKNWKWRFGPVLRARMNWSRFLTVIL
jgi:hypothetical protein